MESDARLVWQPIVGPQCASCVVLLTSTRSNDASHCAARLEHYLHVTWIDWSSVRFAVASSYCWRWAVGDYCICVWNVEAWCWVC